LQQIFIGNGGSKKTWLASDLWPAPTCRPFISTIYFWEPGFDRKRNSEEVDRLIENSKRTASWIVQGFLASWLNAISPKPSCWHGSTSNGKPERRAFWRAGRRASHREQSEEGLETSHYYDRGDLRSFAGHRSLMERFPEAVRLTLEESVNPVRI
jgi:hypothetical protein